MMGIAIQKALPVVRRVNWNTSNIILLLLLLNGLYYVGPVSAVAFYGGAATRPCSPVRPG